jgi:hypothetical protein
MAKAKQIEYLIQSLPIPEPEEVQVRLRKDPTWQEYEIDWCPLPPPLHPPSFFFFFRYVWPKAARLATLEEEMQQANQDYAAAVARASAYPSIILPNVKVGLAFFAFY